MSSPAEAWRRPAGARPFVLGHRGARHAAPENTLPAFELAAAEGADGVEFDVRLDGGSAVVVLHDETLARVTRGSDTRHAEDVPSAEMARADVGAGAHPPRLADVLDWARGAGQRLNIELKSDVRQKRLLLERVRHVLERAALPELVLSSFDPRFVLWLSWCLPRLPRAWLVHDRQRVLRFAPGWRALGASGIHPEHVLANAERVARVHRAGGFVNVWTVNDEATARSLADAGVDAIISDVPGKILEALG